MTPTFPVQTFLALYVAQRLHLNMLATVLGSQISIPPLMPLWWFLYFQVGNVLLRGEWLTKVPGEMTWEVARGMAGTFVVGSMAVALVVGIGSLFVMRGVLGVVRRR